MKKDQKAPFFLRCAAASALRAALTSAKARSWARHTTMERASAFRQSAKALDREGGRGGRRYMVGWL